LPSDRPAGGGEGGRRRAPGEAGRPVPRPAVRDAGRGMDDARTVPGGGVHPAERRADADEQGTDRGLPGAGLLHCGLTAMGNEIERGKDRRPERATPWEYAPAPESKDIVSIQDRYGLFIGGKFVEPVSGRYFDTIDPSNEEKLAEA